MNKLSSTVSLIILMKNNLVSAEKKINSIQKEKALTVQEQS